VWFSLMWFSLVTLILPGLAFASQTTLSKVSDTGEFSSQKSVPQESLGFRL
jgi:hypothetical protein